MRKITFVAAILALAGVSSGLSGASAVRDRPGAEGAGLPSQSDLDALMKKVLERRDENWKKLQQYILDEREAVDVRGPGHVQIWGERRDFTWYIKDGFFIKSPVKVNGVAIPEEDRRKAEEGYLKRAKARDKKPEPGAPAAAAPAPGNPPVPERPEPEELQKDLSLLRQTRQPEFMDSAYFLRFKFEQGNYALVGRETFEGREVLKIEYYPAALFTEAKDKQNRKPAEEGKVDRGTEMNLAIERLMNKVSLVTLWIEPAAAQIVKYTFDNVNLDFLPAPWLVRVSDVKATMTMSQAFKDIWLPRDVEFYFGAMLAIGAFDVRYRVDYHDYRQATTSGRIKLPPPAPLAPLER